jgi:PAS domain S-box-containing protein
VAADSGLLQHKWLEGFLGDLYPPPHWHWLYGGLAVALALGLAAWLIASRFSRLSAALKKTIADHRQAEEALRESEQSYRNQFANNSAMMMLYDPADGKIIDANAAAVSFYGYPRERLLAMSITDINTMSDVQFGQIMASVPQEHGKRFEFRYRMADGTVRDVEVSLSRIHFQGRIAIHSIIQDITERKHAAAEVRKLSQVVEQTPASVVITDQSGAIQYVNSAFVEMTGYTVQEALGKNPRILKSGLMPAETYTQMWRKLNDGQIWRGELQNRRKDGELFWEWAVISAVKDDSGKTTHYVAIKENITERRRAEDALRESEHRYRHLIETAREGVLVAQGDYLKFVNPMMRELTGHTEVELFSKPFLELVHPDDREWIRLNYLKRLKGEAVATRYLLRLIKKDKSPIWVEISGVKIEWEGQPATLNLVTDITDRKRAEAEKEKLEAQNRQLQKAESLSLMAGAIAHHYNNLLMAVMGNLELAINATPPENGTAMNLAGAMQAARKAAEISGLMLTYLGNARGRREPLDLADACRQRLAPLRAAMPDGVLLEAELPSPGPSVVANWVQIQQALTNLVSNAWEACGKALGIVRLIVKTIDTEDIPVNCRFPIDWRPQDDAYACLEVSDTGCGIAPGDIEKLFDPFFSSKFTGRGMGLAVVLGIVRAHDGAVSLASEPGKGSTFRVFLPLSAPFATGN